jgi:N-succinyldiaminopimelate aminotransferase
MNPLLAKLQPYPFERLKQLFQSVTPNAAFKPISLGIGEPKHATPEFIKTALSGSLNGLAAYPATAGEPALRETFAAWLLKRYALTVNPTTQVLPVNGSREALFAFTQVIVDPTKTTVKNGVTQLPIVVCPNPFYQIYEGAALLAGAEPYYVNSDPARNFGVDWDKVPADIWERTQMIFVCSPGNPAGAVMPLDEWKKLQRDLLPGWCSSPIRRLRSCS